MGYNSTCARCADRNIRQAIEGLRLEAVFKKEQKKLKDAKKKRKKMEQEMGVSILAWLEAKDAHLKNKKCNEDCEGKCLKKIVKFLRKLREKS